MFGRKKKEKAVSTTPNEKDSCSDAKSCSGKSAKSEKACSGKSSSTEKACSGRSSTKTVSDNCKCAK